MEGEQQAVQAGYGSLHGMIRVFQIMQQIVIDLQDFGFFRFGGNPSFFVQLVHMCQSVNHRKIVAVGILDLRGLSTIAVGGDEIVQIGKAVQHTLRMICTVDEGANVVEIGYLPGGGKGIKLLLHDLCRRIIRQKDRERIMVGQNVLKVCDQEVLPKYAFPIPESRVILFENAIDAKGYASVIVFCIVIRAKTGPEPAKLLGNLMCHQGRILFKGHDTFLQDPIVVQLYGALLVGDGDESIDQFRFAFDPG